MSLSRFAALILVTLIGPLPADAKSGGVEEAVRLAGSARMAGYLMTDPAQPAPLREAGDRLLSRIGHGASPTPGEGVFTVSPFLRYDQNLNGGFPDDHVTVGGLRFDVAETDQAVSGLIGGATLSYGWREGLGSGTALELRSVLSLGHALEHDLMKVSFGAEACLRHMARRDTYLHACLDVGGSGFELGRSGRVGGRVGVTRIVSALGGVHELTLEGRVERSLGLTPYERGVISAGLLSAMPGPVVWSARFELGQPVDGVLVTRARLQLGATFEVAGEPTTVAIDWRHASGGVFLGEAREDRTVTLSVSRPISDRVRVTAGFTRNASTADPYDRDTVDFGVSLKF